MTRHVLRRRVPIAVGAFVVFGLAGLGEPQPAGAMSCFTVGSKVTCIGAGIAPPSSFMPPVIVPVGANAEGEDHRIVIEDDGGRRVARG